MKKIVTTIPIINCGDASEEGMERLRKAFQALPAYIRKGLEDHGYQIIMGRFLSSIRPYLNARCFGAFSPIDKAIYSSEWYLMAGFTCPSKIEGALTYEAGHFSDFILAGTGEYPKGYSSLQERFKAAAKADVARLVKDDCKRMHELAIRLSGDNYTPAEELVAHFKTIFIEGANRELEIYAETFANMQGHHAADRFLIAPLFPRCAEIVQADHDRLSDIMVPERASTRRVMHRTAPRNTA